MGDQTGTLLEDLRAHLVAVEVSSLGEIYASQTNSMQDRIVCLLISSVDL